MKQQAQHGTQELLLDKIEDLDRQVERRGMSRFTQFLDEREQLLVKEKLPFLQNTNAVMFGGYEAAQRRMLGIFPAGESTEEFPILPITFTYHCFDSKDAPTHRDFLGALMGLGIKRELVGDILVEPGLAIAFLTDTGAKAAEHSLEKVGRVRVSMTQSLPAHLPAAFHLEPIHGTVSSLRLDAVLALLLNLSREKAAALVRSGKVRVNFSQETQLAASLKEKDILSIDGFGRYTISELGGETKKGRIHLTCGKYT